MLVAGFPPFALAVGQVVPGAAGAVQELGLGVAVGVLLRVGQEAGFVEIVKGPGRGDGVVGGGRDVVGDADAAVGGREGGGVRGNVHRWVAVCGGDLGEVGFVVGLEDFGVRGVWVELGGVTGE